MKKIPFTIGLACLSPALVAQTTLPEVLISATRSVETAIDTPANIIVIDQQDIIDSGARHLSELLRTQAGIHLSDAFGDGSNASIDMRGFGNNASSNTLVMIDGRKLNPASDSATLYLNSVVLINVERIEIIQGSSGVLFGNQAVGGVINIITKQPDSQRIDISAGLASYQGKNLSAHASNRLKNGFGYQLSGYFNETDNYRDNNNARLKNLNMLLDYEYANGRVFGEFNHLDEYIKMPGALFADELNADRRQSIAIYANDYIDTQSDTWRLGITQKLSEHWRLAAEASHRDDERDFLLSFRAFPGSKSTQDRETNGFTPRLIGSYPSQHGTTRITLGYDHEDTDYLLVTAFGPQSTDQKIQAVYAQVSYPFAKNWNITTGLRNARVDNDIRNAGSRINLDDEVTVGSVGLSYQATKAWRIFARADQNYRFAKVDEHTNVVFGQPAGLDTQTGISYELGTEFQFKTINVKAQIYQLKLEDEIGFDSSTFFNINLDDTKRNGLTLSVQNQINSDWLIGASYDFIDNEVSAGSFKGNNIPLVPEHEARLFANWTPSDDSLISTEIHYVGEQTLGGDFNNSFDKLDSYTVVNTSAHYYYDNWDFSARINNLFDRRYSETGAIGFDETFTARDGYNPATERNFSINARYGFE